MPFSAENYQFPFLFNLDAVAKVHMLHYYMACLYFVKSAIFASDSWKYGNKVILANYSLFQKSIF